jgi:hypothetical protein
MSEIVTLPFGRYWLDDEGILHGVAADDVTHTLAQAKEQLELQRAMAGDVARPFLMDIRTAAGLERDARTFYAGRDAAKVLRATALLIGSPLSRALGNFFLGLNKPHMPTRLFTDEESAMAWLREHL